MSLLTGHRSQDPSWAGRSRCLWRRGGLGENGASVLTGDRLQHPNHLGEGRRQARSGGNGVNILSPRVHARRFTSFFAHNLRHRPQPKT